MWIKILKNIKFKVLSKKNNNLSTSYKQFVNNFILSTGNISIHSHKNIIPNNKKVINRTIFLKREYKVQLILYKLDFMSKEFEKCPYKY